MLPVVIIADAFDATAGIPCADGCGMLILIGMGVVGADTIDDVAVGVDGDE